MEKLTLKDLPGYFPWKTQKKEWKKEKTTFVSQNKRWKSIDKSTLNSK